MNKNSIKKMKNDEIKIDESRRQEIINVGKQTIMQHQLSRYSLFDLFRSSIRFTSIHTWLIQFTLLILATLLTTNVIDNEIVIIQSLTVAVMFSALFFIQALLQSFTSGMWELEQTLKYDLRQHTIVKLLLFGLVDLVIIIGLALICQGVVAISFWNIILYLLVPFNITCIVLFSLFTVWRNNFSSVVFWISSGLVLMGVMFVTNSFHIYEFGMKYWGAGFILSVIFLGFIVMDMLKEKKWEAFC